MGVRHPRNTQQVLGGALWYFWSIHSRVSEGRDWLTRLLAGPNGKVTSPQAPARALLALGLTAQRQFDIAASDVAFTDSIELARRAGDAWTAAMALARSAWISQRLDDWSTSTRRNVTGPPEHARPVPVERSEEALSIFLKNGRRNVECALGCWKVALAIDPNPKSGDYHWYREDDTGFWSHKPGWGEARAEDEKGHAITDPQSADRGRYSVFCGYFCVCPREIAIDGAPFGDFIDFEGSRATKAPDAARFAIQLNSPAVLVVAGANIELPRGRLEVVPSTGSTQAAQHERQVRTTVYALLYSGRRDPSWRLSESETAFLREQLQDLPEREVPRGSGLGYHGFAFANPGTQGMGDVVRIFNGAVLTSRESVPHSARSGSARSRRRLDDAWGLAHWAVSAGRLRHLIARKRK